MDVTMQLKRLGQFVSSVKNGAKQAFPIVLSCVPIGMAYGILAQQSGLGLWATLGLSLFVFAGASQFMAISMIQNGVEIGSIIGATFIINFRHVLMSASIAPYLSTWKVWQSLLLGGMLTDETFILHTLNFNRGDMDKVSAVALNSSVYIAWAVSGMLGYNVGSMVTNPEAWGLDFALPAMFVGLLMYACVNKMGAVAAVTGGTVAVGLHLMNASNSAVFIGALAGATVGVFFYKKEGADS
jgi:4-azaleucine resistance transporter AzlC